MIRPVSIYGVTVLVSDAGGGVDDKSDGDNRAMRTSIYVYVRREKTKTPCR